MKMSEEMAVRLHRMMWSDMQRDLGDNPSPQARLEYKASWIEKMFPGESVVHNCWLCLYTANIDSTNIVECSCCPIKWPIGYCNMPKFSYRTKPISEILALPARNESVVKKAANLHELSRDVVVGAISQASGLPVECDIWTHIKKIQDEAVQQSTFSKIYSDAKTELAKASGLPEANTITDHIAEIRKKEDRAVMEVLENFSGLKGNGLWVIDHVRKIQEKAVEDYFAKTPGARLATMDVDNAFKQYAEEQTEPLRKIRQQLADKLDMCKDKLSEQSGLDRSRPVDDHIREIVRNSMEAGAAEERDRIQEKIYEVLLS